MDLSKIGNATMDHGGGPVPVAITLRAGLDELVRFAPERIAQVTRFCDDGVLSRGHNLLSNRHPLST